MATLGQKLKAAREAKGISESEAGAAIKTLTRLIVAMEADDFSGMAAPTYAKGFIRLYAGYLGLNPEPLIEEYTARHAPSGPKPLVDEASQLEQNRRKQPVFTISLKWLPAKFNPLTWLGAPARKLTKEDFVFNVKIGEKGEFFGSVNKDDIKTMVQSLSGNISKDDIEVDLEKPIKTLGEHQVEIHLGKGVKTTVIVRVLEQQ